MAGLSHAWKKRTRLLQLSLIGVPQSVESLQSFEYVASSHIDTLKSVTNTVREHLDTVYVNGYTLDQRWAGLPVLLLQFLVSEGACEGKG